MISACSAVSRVCGGAGSAEQRRRPVRRSCCRLTAASTAIWIQHMSGTLSGFSVPSGKHVCPALQGLQCACPSSLYCQSAWFGVSGAATLVFLLAPGSKFDWIWGEESFLVVSRQLIVDLLLRGCNRASLKPFRGLHRVIPSAPVPESSGLGTARYVPPSSSPPASFLRSVAKHSRPSMS